MLINPLLQKLVSALLPIHQCLIEDLHIIFGNIMNNAAIFREYYDYKCRIICKKCRKSFHVYFNYSEFYNHVGNKGDWHSGKKPYSYNCPYCDFTRNTTNIQFVGARLQDGAIDCHVSNYKPIDYAKIHKENKKRSLAK